MLMHVGAPLHPSFWKNPHLAPPGKKLLTPMLGSTLTLT